MCTVVVQFLRPCKEKEVWPSIEDTFSPLSYLGVASFHLVFEMSGRGKKQAVSLLQAWCEGPETEKIIASMYDTFYFSSLFSLNYWPKLWLVIFLERQVISAHIPILGNQFQWFGPLSSSQEPGSFPGRYGLGVSENSTPSSKEIQE